MARKKVRTKDLKKQRWAGIVAAVLALGMIVSLVGVYLGQAAMGGRSTLPEQHTEPQPEDYLVYYQGQVDRLEEYLEENEAGEPILLELAENYRYLSFIQQVFFDNQEVVEEYDLRMISIYKSLVDLEPANLQYRLELVNLYLEKEENRELIDEEILFLQEQLREAPDPVVHLSLVGLLSSAGEEELMQDEAAWLYTYLEDRVTGGVADNEERFYYAVLLGEYLDNPEAAKIILDNILEQEDEESNIYQEALSYRDYLRPVDDNEEIAP